MKTTKVLFVAMLLSLAFMWSCQKEGSMTPDASGSQTFADSESANSGDGSGLSDIESAFIADLQDQLDSLEANFEPNTQVSYQNSNNPYESAGIGHNEALDLFAANLSEIKNPNLSVSYTYYKFNEVGGVDTISETLSDPERKGFAFIFQHYAQTDNFVSIFTSQEFEDWNNSKPTIIDYLNEGVQQRNNRPIEYAVMSLFVNEVTQIEDYNLRTVLSISLENSLVNTSFLTEDEKEKILSTMAVARYSNYYWNFVAPEVGNPSDPNTQWWCDGNKPNGLDGSLDDYTAFFLAFDILVGNPSLSNDPVGDAELYGGSASNAAAGCPSHI